ncbi:hypothetical protein FACS1894206_05620 [Deltaproteobacteria bacterium]|nr:hypothetical protein FACS1894206_05620 [Deltaproteobacteria bacterium]
MPASFSVNSTQLWPTLGESLAELVRPKHLVRATTGASASARTLDRAGGMERTGAAPLEQDIFGGIVAGKKMDWTMSGNYVARDVISRADDLRRGMITLHLGRGNILDTSL